MASLEEHQEGSLYSLASMCHYPVIEMLGGSGFLHIIVDNPSLALEKKIIHEKK